MPTPPDGRLPIVFAPADTAGPDDVVLRATPALQAGHAAGCACCAPRDGLAAALAGLYLRRARGEVPFFRRVVVVCTDPASARKLLARDAFVAARFRLP